ncbi:SRPBCC family protein [Micrococcus lacusdianchii]|uniref:SRPBCC family protein n=1 Tax=Micrococcus lacusdianchii TaxID=2915940 RepID=UPI002004D7F3|nr:SRPBCC family protein [Micrococcus sp. JXJ CY 30]
MLLRARRIHTSRTGPSHPDDVWAAYLHPDRWPSWAPHLTGVETADAVIRPGTTGTVRVAWAVPVPFRVTAVDTAARAWAWDVRLGPWRMALEHTVEPAGTSPDHHDAGTRAGVTVTGPGWLLAAYRPLMAYALGRLTRVA